jgi:hypothetical protein
VGPRGNNTQAYVVTNVSLLAPLTLGRFDVSATLYNVFGVTFGSLDILQQDKRNFRVKTTLHF